MDSINFSLDNEEGLPSEKRKASQVGGIFILEKAQDKSVI